MPIESVVFKPGQVIWTKRENTAGNAPGGLGTNTVNIDTGTTSTQQASSNTFTIGPAPARSPDGKWDTITFDVNYSHLNTVNSGRDIGKYFISIRDAATRTEIAFDSYTIQPEDGPTSTTPFTGTKTATFNNIPPGTYYLWVGEASGGDAEALKISAENGTATETTPVCFAAGTLIETASGMTPVESLKAGDLVRTRDNGLRAVRWIGSQKLEGWQLENQPKLRPIRIKAGALGAGVPSFDLTVSPQHRILVCSRIAQKMFGISEVLIAAKHLCDLDGIEICEDINEVVYFHFLFDQHEIVYSNGAETESLYTGKVALGSIGHHAVEEIYSIFPELRDAIATGAAVAARMLVPGRKAKKLMLRHSKNNCPLIGSAA